MFDNNVLTLILQYFSLEEMCKIRLVSKQFNEATGKDYLWRGRLPYTPTLDWRTEYTQFFAPSVAIYNIICKLPGGEIDEMISKYISKLHTNNYALPIVKYSISEHVRNLGQPRDLLEKNTPAVLIIYKFSRLAGKAYIKETLTPLIKFITDDPHGYKVQPHMMMDGESLEANIQKLTIACSLFLRTIFDSLHNYPVILRAVANHLDMEVSAKFPDKNFSNERFYSSGSFYFHRFVCPAIVVPEAFGIGEKQNTKENKISPEGRKALIVIGKIIQNLVNRSIFGGTETYLAPMNKFLLEHTEECKRFLTELTVVPSNVSWEERSPNLPSILREFAFELSNHSANANAPPPIFPPNIIPPKTKKKGIFKTLFGR